MDLQTEADLPDVRLGPTPEVAVRASAAATVATISGLESHKLVYTQDSLELLAAALRTTPAALISRVPDVEDNVILWSLLQQADAA